MKILVIQTAFIGDVILATPIIELLHQQFPNVVIDVLVRKGNEGLLEQHPYIHTLISWNKKHKKIPNLFRIIRQVRRTHYDAVINVHRFASSGLITFFSGAKHKIGFDKNPLSFAYSTKVKHSINDNMHEVQRNQALVEALISELQAIQPTNSKAIHPKAVISIQPPKLYPSTADFNAVSAYKAHPYICIAPTSVWFTKQFPKERWVELIHKQTIGQVYLLGAASDAPTCEFICAQFSGTAKHVYNLAGKFSFLESAALIKDAAMTYVNDSAPMHIASSMNAPVTAIFCSTIPQFGFGPLSEKAVILETKENLSCRPCGLHGHKQCPQQHFKCATSIAL